jgi:hypothetical protein
VKTIENIWNEKYYPIIKKELELSNLRCVPYTINNDDTKYQCFALEIKLGDIAEKFNKIKNIVNPENNILWARIKIEDNDFEFKTAEVYDIKYLLLDSEIFKLRGVIKSIYAKYKTNNDYVIKDWFKYNYQPVCSFNEIVKVFKNCINEFYNSINGVIETFEDSTVESFNKQISQLAIEMDKLMNEKSKLIDKKYDYIMKKIQMLKDFV